MARLSRWLTPEQALEAVLQYEEENNDLDPKVARLMALAVVGPRVPKATMASVFGQEYGWTKRDYSWRWWNILQLAGLGRYWERFRDTATAPGGSLKQAYDELWADITDQQRAMLLRRSFYYPSPSDAKSKPTEVWTKASIWRRADGFTRILVLKESLAPRDKWIWWHRWQDDEQVERELHNLIDPDTTTRADCKWQAVSYVGSRYQAGHKQKVLKERISAWFFGEWVPYVEKRHIFTPEGKRLTWKPYVMKSWM